MYPPSSIHYLLLFTLLLTLTTRTSSSPSCLIQTPYINISLVQITPTEQQIPSLTESLLAHCEIRFISDIPTLYPTFPNALLVTRPQLRTLEAANCSLHILTEDLSTAIPKWPVQHAGYNHPIPQNRQKPLLDTNFYMQYRTYDTLLEKQDQLLQDYPQFISRSIIGTSVEGRPIHAFFIGQTNTADPKSIFFNGMQHAREWVATVVPHYIMEALCIVLATDAQSKLAQLLTSVQVIVVPIVNPDGYVYSQTTDRFWRKNRRQGTGCDRERIGVDLNRNWDLDYGGDGATSREPCSDVYVGDFVFSEPETAALRDLVIANPSIKAHIDFHSYGQLILGAWAFSEEVPPRVNVVDSVGFQLEKRMTNSSLNRYRFGRGGSGLIYLASGVMQDWMSARDILSYTVELRPHILSNERFQLEEKFLLPTCREAFVAAKTLIDFADDEEAFLAAAQPPEGIDADDVPTGSSEPDAAPSPTPLRSRGGNSSVSLGVIVGSSIGSVLAISVIVGVLVVRMRSRPPGNGYHP